MNTAKSLFWPLLILTLLPSSPFAPGKRHYKLYFLAGDSQWKKGNNNRMAILLR